MPTHTTETITENVRAELERQFARSGKAWRASWKGCASFVLVGFVVGVVTCWLL